MAAREYAARSLRETLLADVELPRLARDSAPRSQPPAGAPRLLLVEDNADLRSFVAGRLSRRYRVETAADGAAGIEAARRLRPDLIVTDVMMPGVDGFELCRTLKADPAFAATPIILLTARAGTEAVAEGLDVGADDYVVKPFALGELEARIAAHLRSRETERQLHERESRLAAIGQMTSSVVHDLRNPLTLVKGYADLAHALALRGRRRGHHRPRAGDRAQRVRPPAPDDRGDPRLRPRRLAAPRRWRRCPRALPRRGPAPPGRRPAGARDRGGARPASGSFPEASPSTATASSGCSRTC